MNDAFASRYICVNDDPGSTLADDGYPARNNVFVLPDGTDEHARQRVKVEHYFARYRLLWKIVGNIYHKGSRWHSLTIRAAFILTNMIIIHDDRDNYDGY